MVDADLSGYFEHDSPCGTDAGHAWPVRVSDKAAAASARSCGNRRTGPKNSTGKGTSTARPATRMKEGGRRREALCPRYWRTSTCAVSCWAGRRWDYQQKLEARIINYADDFCDLLPGHGQRGPDRHAAHDVADQADGERDQNACLSGSCGNVRLPGLHLRKVLCAQTGRAYLGTRPARAKVQKLCRSLSALTNRKSLRLDPEEIVGRFNSRLRGWANYFCLGAVSKAYRAVERHAAGRLRKWLCRKHKVPGQGTARFPDEYLFQAAGTGPDHLPASPLSPAKA